MKIATRERLGEFFYWVTLAACGVALAPWAEDPAAMNGISEYALVVITLALSLWNVYVAHAWPLWPERFIERSNWRKASRARSRLNPPVTRDCTELH